MKIPLIEKDIVSTAEFDFTDDLHPDVIEYVIDGKISLKDAEEINKFETVEQRKQLIQERIKFNKWTEKTSSAIEGDWNKNISILKQQVVDIKTNGDTTLKTDFDVKHQRKLDIEADRAMYFDENTRKKYRKIYSDLATAKRVANPTRITKKEVKKDTVLLIMEMYKLSRLLLLDIGVIRNVSNNDLDFIEVDWSVKEDNIDDTKKSKQK